MGRALVFGYGSLLVAGEGRPCRLAGHRRVWGVAMDNEQTIPGYKYFLDPDGGRPAVHVAFLDAVPDGDGAVEGVVFEVPDVDVVDARERNYARVDVTERLDLDLGAPVWAYLGLDAARERYAGAVAAGTAVVSRAYLEGVRAGFARFGLPFDTPPDVPVVDLVRVDLPA